MLLEISERLCLSQLRLTECQSCLCYMTTNGTAAVTQTSPLFYPKSFTHFCLFFPPFSSLTDGGGAASHAAHQGERGGLSSVLRDLVKPGDENLREMNKKLQNMLEEQLTKNMHLQKVR